MSRAAHARPGRRSSGIAVALALLVAGAAGAQTVVRDVGPGASGRLLIAELAAPHSEVRADGRTVLLPRDSTYARSVVVLGGSAILEGQVQGDVVVVGGDLFLHPGARVSGRVITIGGGVDNSTLATVGGARISFRDNTFDVRPGAGATELAYRELVHRDEARALRLPGVFGFGIPSYDRVDGLSLPWGPELALDSGRVLLDASATYRSDLGRVDPRLLGAWTPNRRTTITADLRRATLTNDAWIRSDLLNSLSTFYNGGDARNYYRADRADVRFARVFETAWGSVTPFVGALDERAWSVGPGFGASSSPYSLFGRRDSVEGMRRVNPPVRAGTIVSGVIGSAANWTLPDLTADAATTVEVSGHAPDGRHFTQATLDAQVSFPTFRDQSFVFAGHSVLTLGDTAPPQRFAYLGGSGTIVTRDLLSLGGDELVFVEGTYRIPITRITVPALGSPTVGLRYAAGAAGVGGLPDFVQNVGIRIGISLLRFDYMIDPVTRDSKTSVSLSLSR